MPNGGHICCNYCDFADSGKCTLYGTPAGINVLCRHYRCEDGLSFGSYLARLEPGVIYRISLAEGNPHDPKPKYRVRIETVAE